MTTSDAAEKKPFWLLIEEKILELDALDLSGENREASIQRIAKALDDAGQNVSRHGGNMLKLRWAMDDANALGRPLLKDFNSAVEALTLEDVANPFAATTKLLDDVGKTWPTLRSPERRPDVVRIIERTKLDLLVKKAKGLADDKGIRLLLAEKVEDEVIIARLEITADDLKQVKEKIKQELAERARVEKLLEAAKDKSDVDKVKHLIENNVAEELILKMAGVDRGAIDAAKQAMEEELKEKQRLAEEEAARKKAEAEGPSLEDIPADQMLDFIESIREIMEFSDVEKEIRVMCEQSSIPKALVDIAVSDPDKLDELEKQAEG